MLLVQFDRARENLPGGVGYSAQIHVYKACRDLPKTEFTANLLETSELSVLKWL